MSLGHVISHLLNSLYAHTYHCSPLEMMTTKEQRRQFLPFAQSFRIITTYAQTELGHETDLRRLETVIVQLIHLCSIH
jgi:alkylation response protein AidB-like acyl-CoA dehydrogenase